MLVQGIKSRPVYGALKPRPGPLHLFVADAEGAQAILDLAQTAPAGFFDKAHIVYVPAGAAPKAYGERLRALNPFMYYEGPSIAAALPRLAQTLATARMGTQLYLAGTEPLVGQAMKATRGKANPAQVNEILRRKLAG